MFSYLYRCAHARITTNVNDLLNSFGALDCVITKALVTNL